MFDDTADYLSTELNYILYHIYLAGLLELNLTIPTVIMHGIPLTLSRMNTFILALDIFPVTILDISLMEYTYVWIMSS